MTISQRVGDVRDQYRQGKPGEWVLTDWESEDRHIINSDPQAVQTDTLTVTGATNAKTYSVIIEGITVSYLSGGAATTATIAQGLSDAINANATVRGLVSASPALAVVTVTGLLAGAAFTMTEADPQLTQLTTQTAASALPIAFGLAVCLSGFSDGGEALGKLARDASFTAQLDSVQYAGIIAGDSADISVTYDGSEYQVSAPFNTDNDTTVGDLRTAATTALGSLPVTVGGAADTITITADLAGDCLKTVAGPKGTLTSNRSRATCAADAFLGISRYSFDEAATTVGQSSAPSYPANAGVVVGTKGRIWVENSQSVTLGESVYVELDSSSADVGKLFNTSSATRAKLPKLEWYRSGISGDNIADLRISL